MGRNELEDTGGEDISGEEDAWGGVYLGREGWGGIYHRWGSFL